jgi:hypothetical protein
MPLPQELDLFNRGFEITARMDNENQHWVRLEFARRQIISA